MPSNQNADQPTHFSENARASKSKSGFNRAGTVFVLVYKLEDGTYTTPMTLPTKDAVRIASSYQVTRSGDPQLGVNVSAAKLICRRAKQKGLLDETPKRPNPTRTAFGMAEDSFVSNSSDLNSSLFQSIDRSLNAGERDEEANRVPSEFKPRYFPLLDPVAGAAEVEVTEEQVDMLAFVLSGIDPKCRTSIPLLNSGTRLKDLASTPSSRIPTDSYMRDDHWFLLPHLHDLTINQFRDQWEETKSRTSGQQGTDIQRLVSKFEKFEIDALGKSLKDPANREFFQLVQQFSVDLLSRIYRKTRRRIEETHEQADAPDKGNWLSRLIKRPKANQKPPEVVPVSPEVRKIVKEYVAQAQKLGRVLRSEMLRKPTQTVT